MANQILLYEHTTCLVCGAKVVFATGLGAHGLFDEHQLGKLDGFRVARSPHVCPVYEVDAWNRSHEPAGRPHFRVVSPELQQP